MPTAYDEEFNSAPSIISNNNNKNNQNVNAIWTNDFDFYGHANNNGRLSNVATSEFVRDVLEDVCDDFERQLEHHTKDDKRFADRRRNVSTNNFYDALQDKFNGKFLYQPYINVKLE